MEKASIVLVLDNIRSTLNVGAIFRTADAVGVGKIYLCGITATPEHPKVTKTALGAEKSVPWKYYKNTTLALKRLKLDGYQIIGLEIDNKAVNFWKAQYKDKIALVVGNEVNGLTKNIISFCDIIIKIPMYGKKESLNVATATGVAVYEIARQKKYLDKTI